jgi:hypothetical protein
VDGDLSALRASCDRFLSGRGEQRAGDLLATVPADTAPDRYGEGGVVADLEAEVAGVLGLPAAVLLRTTPDAAAAAARALAAEEGIWTGLPARTGDPGTVGPELSVGDATMALRDDDVRTAVAAPGR